MYFELQENKPHGTKDNPFSIYHIESAGPVSYTHLSKENTVLYEKFLWYIGTPFLVLVPVVLAIIRLSLIHIWTD